MATALFAPDGTVRDIPDDQLQAAIGAGGVRAVKMRDPQGAQRYVPLTSVQDAVRAGGHIDESTETPKEGFWKSLGQDLGGLAKGALPLLAGPPGLAYGGIKQGIQDFQSIKETGKTLAQRAYADRVASGRAPAYAAAAGVNEALGVNAKGMEQAADSGDVGGVLGHAAAVPAAMGITAGVAKGVPAGLNALKPGAQSIAETLYRSALKPSTTIPLEKSTRIVQTALNNEIPISPEGIDKLNGLQAKLNKTIADTIASDPSATVSKQAVAQQLRQTYRDFQQQVSPTPDLNRIKKVGADFVQNNPDQIPAAKAQAMKQGTYQSIKSAAYGEMKTATVEAQKALARGIKQELEVQFPEIKGYNAQEGRLLELDPILERAVNRIGNHQMIGLGTPIASAAGAAAGGPVGAGAAALLKVVVDNPMVKTRLAIALNQASKGRITVPQATARIAAYSSALGAGASSESGRETQDNQRP